VVLGTLPTGPAYPADPRPELARLVAMNTPEKPMACLRYSGSRMGRVAVGVSTEDATRLSLLGKPVPLVNFPSSGTGLNATIEGEAAAAARRAMAELEAAAGEEALREGHLGARKPHRSAADIWVLDRSPTWAALPTALRLEGFGVSTANAHRMHPAMIANVWDVQRLVTGLLNTPAFLRQHHTSTSNGHNRISGRYGRGGIRGDETERGARRGARAERFCDCSASLQVRNLEQCAPETPPKPVSGYPIKGRLAHWAVPCDYRAVEG